MQIEKRKLTLWQRFTIYLYNKFSSDANTRIHGVPAGIVDTRYENLRVVAVAALLNFVCVYAYGRKMDECMFV